jgi:23S rRNA (cytosine1962-C5)-methyltransferase
MKTIQLREGKERSLLRHHPWVFQGSIERGKADPGETVRVESADGRFLCWGAFSPSSMIRVRAWTFDETERVDHAFFKRRIARALALRARLPIASDGGNGGAAPYAFESKVATMHSLRGLPPLNAQAATR